MTGAGAAGYLGVSTSLESRMDPIFFAATAASVIAAGIALAWLRPQSIVRHPRTVLLALSAISLTAAAALVRLEPAGLRLGLDPSEEPLLRRDDPARDVYAEAIRNFGDDDVFVVVMETAEVFTEPNLTTLRRVSDRIRRLPGVRSAESLVDTTAYRYRPQTDRIEVGRFIDEIPGDAAALAALRRRALADRIYLRTIVSADGRAAAINVSFLTMTDGEFVAAGLDDAIRSILEEEARPGQRFFMAGRQHVKARAQSLMLRDLWRLIPLAVVVGTAVAWLLGGSLRAALVPVGASLVATLWVFGALAFLGLPLNLITIVLGPMLICIGSVYGVHVLARYQTLLGEIGERSASALACLRQTTEPVLIAGATTCAGFGALLLSATPAVNEFGAFAALGVAAVSMISLTGVPALLSLVQPPWRPAVGEMGRGGPARRASLALGGALDLLLDRLARATTSRPLGVLAAWLVVAAAAVACIPRIVVDTDYLTFFDRRSDVRRDFAAVSELLVGALPLYVVLDGGEEGAFREPANLEAVRRLQSLAGALAEVDATLSVVDLIAVLNRAVEKDDPAAERIPPTRGEVADVLFLIPKNNLRRFANANHSKTNLLVRTGASGSAAIRALEQKLEGAIAAAELPPGVTGHVTGNAIVLNRGADAIAGNQLATVSFATLTILLLVARAFRSLRVGLLAMIPNVVPVAIFFGVLGAGVAKLSLPTSLIGCVALGIAVDDTAHFLVAYRRRRAAGVTPAEAAADCVRRLGRPIVITSAMLIAGFLVLGMSGFATLREFGQLSAATMLICLAADLLMLPAILVRTRV